MMNQTVRNVLNYNHTHPDFPMPSEQIEKYVTKCLVQSILWSFTGDSKSKVRKKYYKFLAQFLRVQRSNFKLKLQVT